MCNYLITPLFRCINKQNYRVPILNCIQVTWKLLGSYVKNLILYIHKFRIISLHSSAPWRSDTSSCIESVFLGQLVNVAFAMYQAPLPLISLKQQTVRGRRVPEASAFPHLLEDACVLHRSRNVSLLFSWGLNTEKLCGRKRRKKRGRRGSFRYILLMQPILQEGQRSPRVCVSVCVKRDIDNLTCSPSPGLSQSVYSCCGYIRPLKHPQHTHTERHTYTLVTTRQADSKP